MCEIGAVLRVFGRDGMPPQIACTLFPLLDLIGTSTGLLERLPLEVWVTHMSRWLTPRSMSVLERSTPHIGGTILTKDLVEAMARQRLAEGPAPLLQLASAPLQLLVMTSLELYTACCQARANSSTHNLSHLAFLLIHRNSSLFALSGGPSPRSGVHSKGSSREQRTHSVNGATAALRYPRCQA